MSIDTGQADGRLVVTPTLDVLPECFEDCDPMGLLAMEEAGLTEVFGIHSQTAGGTLEFTGGCDGRLPADGDAAARCGFMLRCAQFAQNKPAGD